MPTYDWVCNSCRTTNLAGSDRCTQCNCPATATGTEITAFSEGHELNPTSPDNSGMGVICCLVVGLWLIGGAIYQTALHKWFPLFPIQLDGVFGFTSAIFGTNAGLYTSSVLAGFLGGGALWVGAIGLRRNG